MNVKYRLFDTSERGKTVIKILQGSVTRCYKKTNRVRWAN